MQIINSDYQKLLLNIQKQIKETEDSIIKTVTRQKVVMAWQVGKLIDEHLSSNNDSSYGEGLMDQLAQDIKITSKVLYKMRGFYQSYPELPEDNDSLNWSHYRTLSAIKQEDERKDLERLVIGNSWSSGDLENEVKKIKSEESVAVESNVKKVKLKTKISPVRGQLFTYPLINNPVNESQKFLDLGFNVFKEIETEIEAGKTVESVKSSNGEYSFKEIDVHEKKLNIYKAYIERIVDGDTIRVIIDLGFKTHHREILRLKQINAPELKTDAGKKSKKTLEDILDGVPFLIIKTIKVDIFGRYVADVFFDENKNPNVDAQEVANSGIYLNQLLLDVGVVEFLDM